MTEIEAIRVEGQDRGKVFLFALSTCVWCRRTKQLLGDLGVAYQYVDVDHLDRNQRKAALSELRRWNARLTYPTVVIGEQRAIVGLNEKQIREALAHG